MGHLINPITFRLGYSRNWDVSGALVESKLQYSYLNFKFFNMFNFFSRLFNKRLFSRKLGIIFSHLRLISGRNSDSCLVYLYDGPMQAKTNKLYGDLKNKKFVWNFFFKFSGFFFRTYFKEILKKKVMFYVRYVKVCQKIFSFLLNYLMKKIYFLLNKIFYVFFYNFQFLINFANLETVLLFFKKCFFFLNLVYKFKISNNFKIFFSYLSCFKYQLLNFKNLIYLSELNSINKKRNRNVIKENSYFFFFYNLFFSNCTLRFHLLRGFSCFFLSIRSLVFSFFLIFKFTFTCSFFKQLTSKLKVFFLKINQKRSLILKSFLEFYFFHNYYFLNFFCFLFKKFKTNKLFDLNGKKKYYIYFKKINKVDINANIIAKYICIRLKQRFKLPSILNPIIKDLLKNKFVNGFRISCKGRFSKKEIAAYKWEKRGKLSLNTIKSFIDYAYQAVILKYSICGIKVWLQKKFKYFKRKPKLFAIRHPKNRSNKKNSFINVDSNRFIKTKSEFHKTSKRDLIEFTKNDFLKRSNLNVLVKLVKMKKKISNFYLSIFSNKDSIIFKNVKSTTHNKVLQNKFKVNKIVKKFINFKLRIRKLFVNYKFLVFNKLYFKFFLNKFNKNNKNFSKLYVFFFKKDNLNVKIYNLFLNFFNKYKTINSIKKFYKTGFGNIITNKNILKETQYLTKPDAYQEFSNLVNLRLWNKHLHIINLSNLRPLNVLNFVKNRIKVFKLKQNLLNKINIVSQYLFSLIFKIFFMFKTNMLSYDNFRVKRLLNKNMNIYLLKYKFLRFLKSNNLMIKTKLFSYNLNDNFIKFFFIVLKKKFKIIGFKSKKIYKNFKFIFFKDLRFLPLLLKIYFNFSYKKKKILKKKFKLLKSKFHGNFGLLYLKFKCGKFVGFKKLYIAKILFEKSLVRDIHKFKISDVVKSYGRIFLLDFRILIDLIAHSNYLFTKKKKLILKKKKLDILLMFFNKLFTVSKNGNFLKLNK